MTNEIEQLLRKEYDWKNDDDLLDLLREYDVVQKELIDTHRWWNEYEYVIKVENTFIRYVYAETTGDMNASEEGYEFDPSYICEMEEYTETIKKYRKKRG